MTLRDLLYGGMEVRVDGNTAGAKRHDVVLFRCDVRVRRCYGGVKCVESACFRHRQRFVSDARNSNSPLRGDLRAAHGQRCAQAADGQDGVMQLVLEGHHDL